MEQYFAESKRLIFRKMSEADFSETDAFKIELLFNETKNVLENYSIFYNKYEVPLLIIKEKKNYIVNNYYEILQSYKPNEKYPTYVTEENGELYFD